MRFWGMVKKYGEGLLSFLWVEDGVCTHSRNKSKHPPMHPQPQALPDRARERCLGALLSVT